jgi:hypothetical protein
MKRWAILLLVLFSIFLTACKAEGVGAAKATPGPIESVKPQKVEYRVTYASCSIDKATQQIACVRAGESDTSYLDTVLNEEALKGWELNSIQQVENHYTFIWQRDR